MINSEKASKSDPNCEKSRNIAVAQPPDVLTLESGRSLSPVMLAYETYGKLNDARDNAILVAHSFTGNAHAAGDEKNPGWWDYLIGKGKTFDTDRFFIICSSVIGGCGGSTEPSSTDPETGRPYGISFPVVTIKDMVAAQRLLIDYLGIEKLFCVVGGSMGGMQALQWSVSYPDMMQKVIAIATTSRLSAYSIAVNAATRHAIESDPDWLGGSYYGKTVPVRGLATARMSGELIFASEGSMAKHFGRNLHSGQEYNYNMSADFRVERWLQEKGQRFVEEFDANAYLYLSKAMDYFDLSRLHGSLEQAFRYAKAEFLIASLSSDLLFPPAQSEELVRALKHNDAAVVYKELHTDAGHDAFLSDCPELSQLIASFLESSL